MYTPHIMYCFGFLVQLFNIFKTVLFPSKLKQYLVIALGKCGWSLSPDAHHYTGISTAEFDVQRFLFNPNRHAGGVPQWIRHHRGDYDRQSYVGQVVRAAKFLLEIQVSVNRTLLRRPLRASGGFFDSMHAFTNSSALFVLPLWAGILLFWSPVLQVPTTNWNGWVWSSRKFVIWF